MVWRGGRFEERCEEVDSFKLNILTPFFPFTLAHSRSYTCGSESP
jgi:hypothetical protein